jgi:hypothetical protein
MNGSIDSRLQEVMIHLMSALIQHQYPYYNRAEDHLGPISDLLPLFANFNVSDFMLRVSHMSHRLYVL